MEINQNTFVAFYNGGELLYGLVAEKQNNHFVVKTLSEEHLLNASRFVLCSKANQVLITLYEFIDQVNKYQNTFKHDDFSFLQFQELSLDQIAAKLALNSDAELFALYAYLKSTPELYQQKKGLFRQKTVAEQETFNKSQLDVQLRKHYLAELEAYIAKGIPLSLPIQSQLFKELPQVLSERSYRDVAALIHQAYPELKPEAALIAFRKRCHELPDIIDPVIASSDVPVGFPELLKQKCQIATGFCEPKALEAFCIDDEDTGDYDDAISLSFEGKHYKLGIHVSLLAMQLMPDDPLWVEAERRVSSLYTANLVVPMFPALHAEHTFSLVKGELRPVLSLYVWLDEAFGTIRKTIELDCIKVQHNHSYQFVDKHLNQEPYNTLHRITQYLEKARDSASGNNEERSYYYVKEKQGRMYLKYVNPNSPSRKLIEELMILYNSSMAAYALEQGLPMIYRNIQQYPSAADGLAATQAYLATQAKFHPGIGAAAYLHASSPIRRFADLINQSQITACLQGLPIPFSESVLQVKIEHLEKQLSHLKEIGHKSERFWWLKYLEQQQLNTPLEAEIRAINKGILRVELLKWGVQVLVRPEVFPQYKQFAIVFHQVDWDEGVLLGEVL